MWSVRSTVDLIELPFAFALRDRELLLPDKFREAMRARGVFVVEQELEALHRARILIPFLRVAREPRVIAAAARCDPHPDGAWHAAYWKPSRPGDLKEERAAGRVYDPAREKFAPWSTYRGRLRGGTEYDKSVFLYAPHQLVALPLVRNVLPRLKWRRGQSVGRLDGDARVRELWTSEAERRREVAIAASAIEPAYYSQVIGGWLRLRSLDESEAYSRWRRKLPLQRLLRWLGINAAWLVTEAEELLQRAYSIDPLGPWWEVIAHGDPDRWPKLGGAALNAMDLRVTAEVLLRYHDALVEAGKAKSLPDASARWERPVDYRLKPRRSREAVLTEFGLSPHPRLVLVLEGATELLLVPRVMRFFGVRIGGDFIAIENAEGADRDLSPLVAYLAPRLGEPLDERYARFERRPSRFLVVFDPEGKVSTAEARESRRQDWIERMMRTLPAEYKTPDRFDVVREQMEQFVFVETWRPRRSESFEFAHFTDLELAEVIHALDTRTTRKPSVEKLRRAVANVRERRRSLDCILDPAGIRKPAHAEPLWPKLERRLARAQARGTETKIPVVHVIDRAIQLAHEWEGATYVMALERQPHAARRRRPRKRVR
jgi:hypothetical protein